ncbi:MAG: OsmC family protein [Pseudomonadota bacterium]
MKTTVTLRASAHCPDHSRADVRVRDLTLTIDEPVERGGGNAGPTPTDTVLAALVGCTNVIGHKCAAKLGIDIGRLDIDVACDFDRRGVTLSESVAVPFTAVRQTVTAHGPASEAELAAVARDVELYCPVARLFVAAGTDVITEWKKA